MAAAIFPFLITVLNALQMLLNSVTTFEAFKDGVKTHLVL